jgi:hypothetical protein
VDHRAQRRVRLLRVEAAYELGGVRSDDREQGGNRLHDAGDTAERQRTCAEAGDLTVCRAAERPYEVDGIARGVLAVVLPVQPVERRLERNRMRRQNVVTGSPARHIGQSAAA